MGAAASGTYITHEPLKHHQLGLQPLDRLVHLILDGFCLLRRLWGWRWGGVRGPGALGTGGTGQLGPTRPGLLAREGVPRTSAQPGFLLLSLKHFSKEYLRHGKTHGR